VRAAGRALPGLPAARLPLGRFEVPVVAPGELGAAAARLPPGGVVFVVRADAPERPTRVTHAGLIVHRADGAPLVRHATSTRGVARVIEEPLARFLAREQAAYPRWPVEGLAFFAVTDASTRVRTLVAGDAPIASPSPSSISTSTTAIGAAPEASPDPAPVPSAGAAPPAPAAEVPAAPPSPAAEVPAAPPPPAEVPPARL
jgi:hypothetical protein